MLMQVTKSCSIPLAAIGLVYLSVHLVACWLAACLTMAGAPCASLYGERCTGGMQTGITLTSAQCVFFAELFWNPGHLVQVRPLHTHQLFRHFPALVIPAVSRSTVSPLPFFTYCYGQQKSWAVSALLACLLHCSHYIASWPVLYCLL